MRQERGQVDSAARGVDGGRLDRRDLLLAKRLEVVDARSSLQPVQVGDTVCCYTEVTRTGRTSITLDVEVWVLRQGRGERVKVTEAEFTFVAVGEDGRPRELASPVVLPVSKRARQTDASR